MIYKTIGIDFECLLKPIDDEMLQRCLTDVRGWVERKRKDVFLPPSEQYMPARYSCYLLIAPKDIVYIKMNINNSMIQFSDSRKIHVHENFKNMKPKLERTNLVIISRLFAFNKDYIKELNFENAYCTLSVKDDIIKMSMSLEYLEKLEAAMNEKQD